MQMQIYTELDVSTRTNINHWKPERDRDQINYALTEDAADTKQHVETKWCCGGLTTGYSGTEWDTPRTMTIIGAGN